AVHSQITANKSEPTEMEPATVAYGKADKNQQTSPGHLSVATVYKKTDRSQQTSPTHPAKKGKTSENAANSGAGEPSCLDAPKALQRISDSSQKRPVRAKVRNTRSTPVSRGKQRQNPTDAVSLNKPNDSSRKEPAIVDRNTTNWIEVKRKKPRPKLKSRPDAIIVKCTEATPYADVLKMMNADPSLQALKGNVQGTRKSAAGELILRMQKQDDPATNQLQLALKTVLSEKALVKTVHETIMIEVHNIDETTTADEVLMALFASFEGDIPSGVAPLMRKAYRGKQIASLVLQSSVATKLLGLKKVQIGWNQCKIRQRVEPTRCFKCMGFGHTAIRCRSHQSVAKDTCFKCGSVGHSAKTCAKSPQCILCTRQGLDASLTCHSTLSRSCPEYKSCYIAPRLSLTEFSSVLDDLAQEDAQHAVFQCPRFGNQRQWLEEVLGGPITEANLVSRMLESVQNWEATSDTTVPVKHYLKGSTGGIWCHL
ncbi:hypothetical protein ACLKA6_001158, partial [Drosophila palustris]